MVSQKSKVRIKIGSFKFGKGYWLSMEGSEVKNLTERRIEIICEAIRRAAKFARENPNNFGRVSHSSTEILFE